MSVNALRVPNWEIEFEAILRRVDQMPPSLLDGLLRHVVKSLYNRGVIGASNRSFAPHCINGRASEIVKQIERQLRDDLSKRYTGNGPSRDLDVTPVRVFFEKGYGHR